jgi:hypothetical protein
VDSGIIPVLPERRELNVDSNAAMAEGAMPSASIFDCETTGTVMSTFVIIQNFIISSDSSPAFQSEVILLTLQESKDGIVGWYFNEVAGWNNLCR